MVSKISTYNKSPPHTEDQPSDTDSGSVTAEQKPKSPLGTSGIVLGSIDGKKNARSKENWVQRVNSSGRNRTKMRLRIREETLSD